MTRDCRRLKIKNQHQIQTQKLEETQEKAIDYEALSADFQTRKNKVWQEAIHTAKLQHKQNLDANLNVFSVEHNSRASSIETVDFQTRRNEAWQGITHTVKLQHKQNLDDTDINISSPADFQSRINNAKQGALATTELQDKKPENTDVNISFDDNSRTSSVETQDDYQISLKYSRRLDLIDAFESVANGESKGLYISVLV